MAADGTANDAYTRAAIGALGGSDSDTPEHFSQRSATPPPLPATPPAPRAPEPVPPIPPIDSIPPDQLPAYIATIKGQTDALLKQTAELQKQNEASGARIEQLLKEISSTRAILQELKQLREGGVIPKKSDAPAPQDAPKIVPPVSPTLDIKPADAPGAVKDKSAAEHERDLLMHMLGIGGPEAMATLQATFDAYPENDERSRKIKEVVTKRRGELWKDAVRVTSEAGVKEICEKILKFQDQPPYVRWGLSGVMGAASKGAAVAMAGSTIASFAALGAVTCVPVSIPVTVAFAIGAGRYKQMRNVIAMANEMGRGQNPFIFKHPHTIAALSAVLYGSLAYAGTQAVLTPGGRLAIQNFFSAVGSKTGATLSQLFSYLSAGKALSIKGTVAL